MSAAARDRDRPASLCAVGDPPVVNFAPEGGEAVVIVPVWSPGVEVVQGFGGVGARVLTALPEGGPGIKPVFVTPGTLPVHLDPAAQAAAHAAQAYQAQVAAASAAADAQRVATAQMTAAAFLLLL